MRPASCLIRQTLILVTAELFRGTWDDIGTAERLDILNNR